MEIIKFFVELRYKGLHRLFTVYDQLYATLTGEEVERAPVIIPGFGLGVKEKKMRLIVDPERSVVDMEYVPNPGYCIDIVMQVFRRINELIPLPPLIRLGARSFWIKPANISFEELVLRYKDRLFKENALVQSSVDVGLSLRSEHEGCGVNISFRPAELVSLQSLLFSPPSELPQVSTFLDIDYYLRTEGLDYSEKDIRDFVKRAYDFAIGTSQKVEAIIVEVLR